MTNNYCKYVHLIDDLVKTKRKVELPDSVYVWNIDKPQEAYGLLKWKIRIIKARYILIGKADAVRFTKR